MTEHYINTTTNIVDGSSYTPDDTIIIRGGARGNLLLKNFDGNGSYIPIINEDGTSRVEITNDNTVGTGIFSLSNCKYVDLRGNNDGDFTYGIHVRNCDPARSGTVKVYGESDHIKLGYLEADCIGNTSISGIGIQVQDASLTNALTFDTFKIYNNYIHDTRYSGMYLGHNNPWVSPYDPYIANFSVHDNLLEDLGAYGITMKGVLSTSGTCSIYNNIIRPSDRSSTGGSSTGLVTSEADNYKFGIGGSRFAGSVYANIYNNWIEKTVGAGLSFGDQSHQIYNNTICGCGTGNHPDYGHGIITRLSASDVHIYDNIIIQPKRYGVYALSATISALMSRNLIGDAGIGQWGEVESGDLTESTGDDANTYHADVANFGFTAWSDDGDYSNDDFSFPIPSAKGQIVNLTYPVSLEHGAICDINAATKNIGTAAGIFKMQLFIDAALKATSPVFTLEGGAISIDKIDPFKAPSSGESMDIIIKCIRSE